MFDYIPVGLSVALIGLAFLSVGWRLLPGSRRAAASLDAAFNLKNYTAEARVEAASMASGRRLADVEAMAKGDVQMAVVMRERFRRLPPRPELVVRDCDVMLLRGESVDLERLVACAGLTLAGAAGARQCCRVRGDC